LNASHRRVVPCAHAGIFHIQQHLVTVLGGESLHDLDAAAVPVHVAEAAGIHEDVEAELLPRAEAAQHLVVLAAMPQPHINDLPPPALTRDLYGLANLAIRMMAVFV